MEREKMQTLGIIIMIAFKLYFNIMRYHSYHIPFITENTKVGNAI